MRELPIVPLPCDSASLLVRGQIVQWSSGGQMVQPWSSASVVPLGVCTADADLSLAQVDVYCGKGASVLLKCAPGVVPAINDLLYYGTTGAVSNTLNGPPFARAIGIGFNGYVEAIIT
jgi:hypothetical protein